MAIDAKAKPIKSVADYVKEQGFDDSGYIAVSKESLRKIVQDYAIECFQIAFDAGKFSATSNYLNHAGFQHAEIEKDKQELLSKI